MKRSQKWKNPDPFQGFRYLNASKCLGNDWSINLKPSERYKNLRIATHLIDGDCPLRSNPRIFVSPRRSATTREGLSKNRSELTIDKATAACTHHTEKDVLGVFSLITERNRNCVLLCKRLSSAASCRFETSYFSVHSLFPNNFFRVARGVDNST